MNKRIAGGIALLAMVVLVVAALAFTVQRPAPDGTRRPGDPHSVSGQLSGRQEGHFEIVGGTESVTIHSSDLGETMYIASTLPGSTVAPKVVDHGDRIELRLAGTAVAGQATVHVYLNLKVRWRLKLAGGGLQQVLDFGTGRLSGVELLAGAGEVDLSLPAPEGTVPIRLSGSAGRVAIHTRTEQPAQVRVGANGSAGTVSIDGQVREGIAPGAAFTPTGWAGAPDRYDIEADAAVATLTVD
jgi:hypothetical protein